MPCGCIFACLDSPDPIPVPLARPRGPLVVFIARSFSSALLVRVDALHAGGIDAHLLVDDASSLPDYAAASAGRAAAAVAPGAAASSNAATPAAPSSWSPDALRGCSSRAHSVDEAEARRLNWTGMTAKFFNRGKAVTGWEKATLWAHGVLRADAAACAESESGVRPVWFVEDDVWWSESGLTDLFSAYAESPADLIAQRLHPTFGDGPMWPHWSLANGVVPKNFWACSFNVVSRVSFRVLDAAAALARARGRLTFHELLFPSLVGMLKAGVFRPKRAAAVVEAAAAPVETVRAQVVDASLQWFEAPWSTGIRFRPEWSDAELLDAVETTPARVFHPVKREIVALGERDAKRQKTLHKQF